MQGGQGTVIDLSLKPCLIMKCLTWPPNGKNRGKSEKIENLSLSMLIIYKNVPSVQIWYRLG